MDDIGGSPPLDSECKGISPKLLNEEIPIQKTLQKLKVKNNYLKDVLKWHHLSKESENTEIENWVAKDEWSCRSSKNLEDFSETFIVCESLKE